MKKAKSTKAKQSVPQFKVGDVVWVALGCGEVKHGVLAYAIKIYRYVHCAGDGFLEVVLENQLFGSKRDAEVHNSKRAIDDVKHRIGNLRAQLADAKARLKKAKAMK